MKHDWEYKKLGEVCEVINGLWTGKKPPFVKVGVIRNTNFTKFCTLDDSAIFYTDVEEKAYAKRKLQKGDIIIEKSGGSEKQPVGRPILFDLDGEYSFSNFTSTLRINDGTILPSFLHKVLVGLYFQGKTRPLQSKTTGIHNLDFNKFLRFQIPVPALAVQERIVGELDKVREVIEKKKEQLKELDTLAQSIFYDMFGDPVENEKGWEKISVKDASVKITDGSHNPPKGIDHSKYRMISSQNITDNGIVLQNIRYLTKEDFENENKRTNLQSGDVLLTIVGTIGRTCVLRDCDGVFTLQRSVAVIRPTDNINSIFLQHQFIQCRCELEKEAHGIAQKGIYLKQLAAFHIILPPLSLQQAFAEKVEAIEKQKELINQSIKEAQLLFDSRMEYWFGE